VNAHTLACILSIVSATTIEYKNHDVKYSRDNSHSNATLPSQSASPNLSRHSNYTPTSSSSTSPAPFVMDQQLAQIVGLIQVLDSNVTFRFDSLEQRVANVENAVVRFAGPAALSGPPSHSAAASAYGTLPLPQPPANASSGAGYGYTQAPPQPAVATSSRTLGSHDNAQFLPFAIVSKSQCTKCM
jgi:hypothetical protein